MVAKVVKFIPNRPQTFTQNEELIDDIREAIFATGKSYKLLAIIAGVAPSTIGNIASGKTKWPRPTTILPLLASMGKTIRVVDL